VDHSRSKLNTAINSNINPFYRRKKNVTITKENKKKDSKTQKIMKKKEKKI
jgi:hypothetical protein